MTVPRRRPGPARSCRGRAAKLGDRGWGQARSPLIPHSMLACSARENTHGESWQQAGPPACCQEAPAGAAAILLPLRCLVPFVAATRAPARRCVRVMWTVISLLLRLALAAPRGARTGRIAAAPAVAAAAAAAAHGAIAASSLLDELTTAWAAARLASHEGSEDIILNNQNQASGSETRQENSWAYDTVAILLCSESTSKSDICEIGRAHV